MSRTRLLIGVAGAGCFAALVVAISSWPSPIDVLRWGSMLSALQAQAQQTTSTVQVEYVRFTPVAIFTDGVDEMTLEVRVTGPVARVEARNLMDSGFLQVDGDNIDRMGRFELFPAGEGVFVRAGITSEHRGQAQRWAGIQIMVVGEDGRTRTTGPTTDGRFFLVDPGLRRPVHSLAQDVQATTHLVNIRAEGDLFAVGPSTEETKAPGLARVAQVFYRHFPDEYDFLSVFTSVASSPYHFFHATVQNSVRGIGLDTFDRTTTYGSQGRLLGMNFLNLSTGGALMHETTHQIGVFLDPRLELGDGTGHWGAVNIPGFLQGLDFEALADGAYRITWTRFGALHGSASENRRMPPMELYLWGLLPPEEVPEIAVLRGVDPRGVRAGDVVSPTDVRTVSIRDVITLHGPRIPTAGIAPTSYRMAGILITPGRLASEAEMALWSRVMEHFGSQQGSALVAYGSLGPSFHFATGGRAQVDTTISLSTHGDVGEAADGAEPMAPAIDEVELAYDGGIPETGYGWAQADRGYAVRLTPPSEDTVLLTARLYVFRVVRAPAPIRIHVWDAARVEMIEPFEVTPTETGWFDVDLSAFALHVGDGDFYVGYTQTLADKYPLIGLDTGDTPTDRSYHIPAWSAVLPAGANMMIRAVVSVERGYPLAMHSITNIRFDPPSPATLEFNDRVTFTFDYTTTEPGGVYIWGTPFTGGSLPGGSAMHGSVLHPMGEGSLSGFFTITAGAKTVDQVRFRMTDADRNVLYEALVDVSYTYR
jgi:hypothetical protein